MSPASDDTPVRVGGRYRLDERIGAGAMGAVWRGTDELLNRTVAVKELLAAAAPPTAAGIDALEVSRQRILREGRIGARLQHPHVISMFDVVVHEDRPWLVMEYLPSRSLAQLLGEKGPLPSEQVADIGRQVADGLAAAHLAGVTHRDVKPGNVLIADDGRVKLTDFGVSRAVDDVQLTRTGLIAGTPAFLSPEVARGLTPTAASDVFALGATLYAAAEGTPPFGLDDNAYALLHKVATEQVRPPKQEGPVIDVIMRLLSREPEDRPSAAQARDAFAAIGTGGDAGLAPLAATPASTAVMTPPAKSGPPTLSDLPSPAPGRPGPRRNRRTPVLLGVLVAVLALGAGVTAAILTSGGGAESGGTPAALPATSAPAVPAPTSDPAASTPPPATTVPATTAPTTAPTSPSTPPSDPVAFVQSYYGLLPGDTDSAWQLLGSEAQRQSNGRGGYDRFWSEMASVNLQNVRRTSDSTVEGTVVFTRRDGSTSSEPYRFVMGTGSDGQTIIESFSRL
ncbi:serine/threonine protein kinase [Pseudonocardia hierapolitana]|uniref:non-specific serine/threonine protein kinase n=1 Tax=Pseudonocardia hierapolitana TaxID=1128676 RepID=A0A561SW13_9PSEU|nr:serine/threonine-protein kinase [Pseudonocardia hierapolitana]TWF79047.1 serine/threonine protein kinase [Pseudonocardia hierapolitana]